MYAENPLLPGAGAQGCPSLFIGCDFDGSVGLVIDPAAGFLLQLPYEIGVKGAAPERKIGPVAALEDFAARREHAGAGPARFPAGLAPVEQGDAQAALGKPPGD
jgi:hypothetical protein